MRCEKQPLKDQSIRCETRPELIPHAGRGETIGSSFHKVASSCDITARRRKSAAGIFDERSCHDVDGLHVGRLRGINEFAVAVVHETDTSGIRRFHARSDLPDVRDAERAALAVPA